MTLPIKVENRTTSNHDLYNWAKEYELDSFGIFRSNEKLISNQGIINFDIFQGTHWVAFVKDKDIIYYFAPYGVKNLKNISDTGLKIIRNTLPIQNQYLKDLRCGWLCINFLILMDQTHNNYYKVLSIIEINEINLII